MMSLRQEWGIYTLLVMTVLAGLLIRFQSTPLNESYIGGDDVKWVIAAQTRDVVASRPVSVPSVYWSRPFYLFTVNAWAAMFGYSSSSLCWLMLCCVIANNLLLIYCLRYIYGVYAALSGALFYAVFPLFTIFELWALPDGPGGTFLFAATTFAMLGIHKKNGALLGSSAFLFGFAFGFKAYFILGILPLFVALVSRLSFPNAKKRLALSIFSFILGLGIAYFANSEANTITDTSSRVARLMERDTTPTTALAAIFFRSHYVRWLFGFGLIPLLAIAFASSRLAAERLQDGKTLFLFGCVITYFGFLIATPISFSPLVFIQAQPRYLLVLGPCLTMLVGAGFHDLMVKAKPKPFWIAGFLVIASVWSVVASEQFVTRYNLHLPRAEVTAVRKARAKLERGATLIVSDGIMLRLPQEIAKGDLSIIVIRESNADQKCGYYLSRKLFEKMNLSKFENEVSFSSQDRDFLESAGLLQSGQLKWEQFTFEIFHMPNGNSSAVAVPNRN